MLFGLSSTVFAQDAAAIRANAEGNRAYFGGKFAAAIERFDLAFRLATDANDDQYKAIAMYGLARANAQLCRLGEAEKWFRASIDLREKLSDEKYAMVTQNYLEFSRYLMAHGRTSEAIPYMDRAVPNLERLGVEKSDPIGYADYLDTYAIGLRVVGRGGDSEKATAQAKELRDKFPNRSARFKPDSYPTACSS